MDRVDQVEEMLCNLVHDELHPDEQDMILLTAYRLIHCINPTHSCYDVHADWRAEFGQTDYEND